MKRGYQTTLENCKIILSLQIQHYDLLSLRKYLLLPLLGQYMYILTFLYLVICHLSIANQRYEATAYFLQLFLSLSSTYPPPQETSKEDKYSFDCLGRGRDEIKKMSPLPPHLYFFVPLPQIPELNVEKAKFSNLSLMFSLLLHVSGIFQFSFSQL